MANKILKARPANGPVVEGYAFVCPTSIQGWSSIDTSTGVVLEKGHVHEGDSFAGKILVVPCSRGSLHTGYRSRLHNTFNSPCSMGKIYRCLKS